MPFTGGDADKVGNRYEALWTVYCLLRILHEEADSIHIEQIEEQWNGIEFSLDLQNQTEYHQVKRQNGSKGHWPIAALANKLVLQNAYRLYQRNHNSNFIFVSTDSVAQLPELIHRSLATTSYDVFLKNGIKPHEHANSFNTLCEYLAETEKNNIYSFLRTFKIETISESRLMELAKAKTASLIDGNVENIIYLLRSFCENNLQVKINASKLWIHLKKHGFSPIQWAKDSNVHLAIEQCNIRYSYADVNYLINKQEIFRLNANEQICTALQGEKKIVAVIGGAGSGKSIVMQQVFNALSNCGTHILGFRIDRLEPQSLPKNIGQALGLPESPIHVLAKIAGNSPSVLFVDQLDAVSLTSGRNPHFFNCIDELFRQITHYPKMKLVVGCREFDIKNDYRFRHFLTEETTENITINHLSDEEVTEQLNIAKISRDTLNKKQLLLLRQPLLLNIFTQVASNFDTFNFSHIGDLFNLQVKQIKLALRERLNGKKIHWSEVMKTLSEYMNKQQTLSAPDRILEEYENDAHIIASFGVLIHENGRYSFFHESFFDYIFANNFIDKGIKICELLLNSEQHLFRRAQVRQILTLQRSENNSQYLINIEELLNHKTIRLHIKASLLSWMGTLENPEPDELRIILEIIQSSSNELLKNCAWQEIAGKSAWFKLLHRENIIYRWLIHDEENWVNRAVWYLRTMQREEADLVADLLLPLHQQNRVSWQQRLVYIVQWSEIGASRKFFDFFLLLLTDGVLDEAKGPIATNADFWSLVYSLPKSHPEWVGEFLVTWINRQLIINPIRPDKIYSLKDGHSAKDIILSSAKKAPIPFFASVFPLVVELAKQTQKIDENPYCIGDSFWGIYLGDSFEYHMHFYILNGIKTAIELIAKNNIEYFLSIFNNWQHSYLETIQQLLIAGLVKSGAEYSDLAIYYLISNNCRLVLGSGHGWLSRQLIEATTPYCSDEQLTQLEDKLLDFYGNPAGIHTWSNKKIINKYFGYDQFTLLTGICESRQSQKTKTRIKEWQRKFLCSSPASPLRKGRTLTQVVRSPISVNAIKHMSDIQWLKAIEQYNSNDYHHHDHLKGGPHQLSRHLQEQTSREPARFAELCLQLPENSNRSYFEAILMGLSTINNQKVEHIEINLLSLCITYILTYQISHAVDGFLD